MTNPAAAVGGAERESIEHAVEHAPAVFRTRARHSIKRAVTAEDYKALALDFSGVGKVRAEAANWNIVTLFVAPAGGGLVSDVLEADLLAYFEDKRLRLEWVSAAEGPQWAALIDEFVATIKKLGPSPLRDGTSDRAFAEQPVEVQEVTE